MLNTLKKIILRPYQTDVKNKVYNLWNQSLKFICLVLPTGAGKTVVMSEVIRETDGAICAIAHRQELVGQISKSLAANNIHHNILAPKNVIREITSQHMDEFGSSFFVPNSKVVVAGVDTLLRRVETIEQWRQQVFLWVIDECHHLIEGNKWGKAAALFPNARGLGVTATPLRADGKGLGSLSDGIFEGMVVGLSMRDLIDQGFLTEYKIYSPPTDLDLSQIKVSETTGDYVPKALKEAVQDSNLLQHEGQIVGDVVSEYMKLAKGRKGVTFATDVETATEISRQFNTAGIPSEIVSAKTDVRARNEILKRFKNGDLLQLVNVDLFGEGFDLPAIEVVSMARPTKSYALYIQQFGRALRIMDGKEMAYIIDHVGNVFHFAPRHGKPCSRQNWSLSGRGKNKRNQENVVPVKACPNCTGVYDRIYKICPDCGFEDVPDKRSSPEFVDGDLTELDPEVLAAMQKDVDRVDRTSVDVMKEMLERNVPEIGRLRGVKLHKMHQEAQSRLRDSISVWAGYWKSEGFDYSKMYRKFYCEFGLDVLTATALDRKETETLNKKVNEKIEGMLQ